MERQEFTYADFACTPQYPFGPNMMAFTSPEDLMKNLPKAMANISRAMGGTLTDPPTISSERPTLAKGEYEDIA
jgi:hypothetical protein